MQYIDRRNRGTCVRQLFAFSDQLFFGFLLAWRLKASHHRLSVLTVDPSGWRMGISPFEAGTMTAAISRETSRRKRKAEAECAGRNRSFCDVDKDQKNFTKQWRNTFLTERYIDNRYTRSAKIYYPSYVHAVRTLTGLIQPWQRFGRLLKRIDTIILRQWN